jgi:hypothetical protein
VFLDGSNGFESYGNNGLVSQEKKELNLKDNGKIHSTKSI